MAGPFVDRIEGELAVLLVDGEERTVPLSKLPRGVREGVYLTADLSGVDEAGTAEARERVERKRQALKKDDGGDFSL
ncbi:MAG: DUF3006 domain-containing protein [Myxococcales bacterium]